MRWVGLLVAVLCGLATVACTGGPPYRPSASTERDAVEAYRDDLATDLIGRNAELDELAQQIEAETPPVERADRFADEVLPRLRDLQAMVEDYHPATARIAAAHEHAVRAVQLATQATVETIRGYRAGGDTAVLGRAHRLRAAETGQWQAWLSAVLAL